MQAPQTDRMEFVLWCVSITLAIFFALCIYTVRALGIYDPFIIKRKMTLYDALKRRRERNGKRTSNTKGG